MLALDICRELGLSGLVQRYAVAWGLLHDISNWPLSHTGESAFSKITGLSTYDVRELMITGDARVSTELRLDGQLREIGVEPARLLSLYRHEEDRDLLPLAHLIASPLTPDVLEGMWRCGRVFDIHVVEPWRFRDFLTGGLAAPLVSKESSREVLSFWRQKAEIYDRFINNPNVVLWESAWSNAIQREYSTLDLMRTLWTPEDEIVARVLREGLPKVDKINRWRPPHTYSIEPKRTQVLHWDSPVDQLCTTLTKHKTETRE